MKHIDRVEAPNRRRRTGKQTVRTLMVTVALLGLLAALVMAVPATADEGGDVTTPEVSFHTVMHRWGGFFDPVNRAILYSGRLDDRGELSAYEVGDTGFKNIVAIAFSPGGTLFGVQGANGDNLGPGTLSLVTIDTRSGRGEIVGPLGVSAGPLTFDCAGNLWMAGWGRSAQATSLHSVDPDTGEATEVGPLGEDVVGLAARGTTVFGVGQDDLVTIDTSTGAATEVGPLADASLDPAGGLAFGADGTLWGPYYDDEAYHRPGDKEAGLFTVDTDSGSVTARAASPYDENGRPSYGFHAMATGGPLCVNVPAQAASSTGTPPDAAAGPRDAPVAESRSGNAQPAQLDAYGPGPAASSGRSEDGTAADRAPTAGGGGDAGEPDDRALTAASRPNEQPPTTGWPTARSAALVLAALAVMATGWRRLTRSRS